MLTRGLGLHPDPVMSASFHDADGDSILAPMIRDISSSRVLRCAESASPADFAAGVFFGDGVDSPERMRASLSSYRSRYGAVPSLVKTFHSLEDDFSETGRAGRLLRALADSPGVTPLLSLEPTWHGSPQHGLLDIIAAGQADARLIRIARGLSGVGPAPILIELGAEMNGRFGAPWQAGQNGDETAPAAFVRAWRHVVDVMRAHGAGQARWIFAPSPGNPYTHEATGPAHWAWYGHWYPGDAYVDFVGLHAFNHAREQGAWVPFIELVTGDAADHMLDDMIARFPGRRIILGEFATSEHPSDRLAKGRWIADAYRRMRECAAIAGVVWFDMRKETDWHIESSREAAAAYLSAAHPEQRHRLLAVSSVMARAVREER